MLILFVAKQCISSLCNAMPRDKSQFDTVNDSVPMPVYVL
jgi:hypothetical protein